MDQYNYDANGNRIDANGNRVDTNGDRVVRTDTTVVTPDTGGKVAAGAAGFGFGMVVVIVAIILAVFGWFWYSNTDMPRSVVNGASTATGSVINKTKDIAAEVPQAAKDATTSGDQLTTRPNADGSTKNLNQK